MVMDINIFYLYIITNSITSDCYIGITENLKARWHKHRHPGNKAKHLRLYRSMNKHGSENFFISILEEHETRDSAKRAEIEVIAMFNSTGVSMFNASDGGDGSSGYKWTDEQKSKLSAQKSGITFSNEHKIALSKSKNRTICDQFGNTYESTLDAAKRTGIKQKSIQKVISGARNSVFGYMFKEAA